MYVYMENNNIYFRKGIKHQKMAENILANLKTDRVHRIDVNFQINTKFLLNLEILCFFL